uniref:Uncharacterized protein n=1 Tax=Mastacembelus armatus TaxID=205130 RepID=A0A3Q3KS50_9TELE
MPKIKGPEFDLSLPKKDVDVTLPEAKAEVTLPHASKVDVSLGSVDVSIPDYEVEVEKPELDIKPLKAEGELDVQGSKFKMPKFGIKMPKMKGPEFDLSLSKKDVDVTLPEAKAEVTLPDAPKVDISLGKVDVSIPEYETEVENPKLEIKPLKAEGELDVQGSRFKMPKFGISMPKIKGPEFDLSLPKKDVDVTLPEAKAEVTLPDAPKVDVSLGKVAVSVPDYEVEVEKSELELKPLKTEGELDVQGSRFKMPKFGIKMPKIKGPEFDLSLSKKDVDVTLPEAKAEVTLPDAPKVDVSLGKVDVSVPDYEVEVEKPKLEIKPLKAEGELDVQGSKFKMPRFGIKMPKMKGPEFDLSLSKKDVDVTLPEAKAEVTLPDAPKVDISLGKVDVSVPEYETEVEKPKLEIKPLKAEGELDVQGSRFKMPKFGISMPKIKGPEFDLSLPKKDVDVTLPEAKAEVTLPDAPKVYVSLGKVDVSIPDYEVEVEKPKLEIKPLKAEGELDVQGSRFKMPKFGISMPKIKGPEFDLSLSKKDVDVTLPEAKAEVTLPDAPKVDISLGSVDVSIPEYETEVEKPKLDIKPLKAEGELDVQGSRFKMPKFGISMPKIKGPEFDLSLPKKDVDVTLPEAKAEVTLPDAPKVDVSLGKVDVSIPDYEVEVEKSELELKPLKAEGELDVQGRKFKMPKFGIKMPKMKGPEFDLKAKAEVTLPDAPKVDISLGKVDVSVPDYEVEVEKPKLEIKPLKAEGELDVQGSKFKMPKFGIKMPKMKGPEFDLSLSKKDVDVTLPEAKAEVTLPDAPKVDVRSKFKMPKFVTLPDAPKVDISLGKVDVSVPDYEVEVEKPKLEIKPLKAEGELDVQGSRFKMPKFGISMPKIKGPEFDLSLSKKDVDVTLPEAKAEVTLPDAPKVDVSLGKVDVSVPDYEVEVEKPKLEIKPLKAEGELDVQGSKFKMPKFGIKMPKMKGPEFDLSLSKKDVDVTLPEAKAEVTLPDAPKVDISLGKVDVSIPEYETEVEKPKLEIKPLKAEGELDVQGSSLPKKDVDVTLPEAKAEVTLPDAPKVDVSLGKVDVSVPDYEVEVEKPKLEIKPLKAEGELDVQGSKFKMPKFGIKMPKMKGPEFDLSLSKKDVDVTLPEAKAEVTLPDAPKVDISLGKFKLPSLSFSVPQVKGHGTDVTLSEVKFPDVELKEPPSEVEIKAPESKVMTKDTEGSPSKFKMPTFKLPKFGAATPQVSVEGPNVDKDITVEGTDLKIPDAKAEVKLPEFEIKEPAGLILVSQPPMTETDAKLRKTSWTMPKLSFSKPSIKASEADVNIDDTKADITLPEVKTEVHGPGIDITDSSSIVVEGAPTTLDAKFKKTKFSLPKFSFSKQSTKEHEVEASFPDTDVSIPGGSVEGKQPEVELKPPEGDVELDAQESKFKMPRFGISMAKVKGPEIDITLPKTDVDVTVSEAKAEVTLPGVEVKESEGAISGAKESTSEEIKVSEVETKSKAVKGSPLKFQVPTLKMPKFGSYDVNTNAPDTDKTEAETDEAKHTECVAVNIKVPSVDITTDVSKVAISDSETGKTETETVGHGSPSKFKLPSFKMPKLSFSRSKPEDEYIPVGTESKEDQIDMDAETKGESSSAKLPLASFGDILKNIDVEFDVPKVDKVEENLDPVDTERKVDQLDTDTELKAESNSAKSTLASFGEILKNFDVEFDVPKTDKMEENLQTSNQVHETDGPSEKKLEVEEKETKTKQDITKSPERTGWFKFPNFGLSSPSKTTGASEKEKDEKSPGEETRDEEISPTCSVQSSEAFADISSTMTSEHGGLSLASPTKVTVKYSDPNAATGLGEMHSNIITSTTRTEMISVEPNLPEKITILSSGISSSSEETLRLQSGKIHVVTSNIQATPEAHHAKILTAVQVQPSGGLPIKSVDNKVGSWTVEDSQSSRTTIFEKQLVTETSSERSETVVITKQITHVFDSSEPISGETASSIQRLRDSVHSEKMRFFDGAEK